MKFSPFIAPSIVLMIVAFNQTFAGSAPENQAAVQMNAEKERITQVSETCYQGWQNLDWTIGENGMAAANRSSRSYFNPASMRLSSTCVKTCPNFV